MLSTLFPTSPGHVDILRRTCSFLIGLLVMLSSGSVYMFSVYSGPLGDQLGYNAKELAFIVTFGQSVFYIAGVPMGMLADGSGGRIACFVGAIINCVSYLLIIFTYTGQIPESHYLLFSLYYSLTGIGSAAAYAGALAVNVKIFPESIRGIVVGLHVALYGLSSLVFTQISSAYFLTGEGLDVAGFLICLMLVMVVVNLLASVLLYDSAPSQLTAPTFLVNEGADGSYEDDDHNSPNNSPGNKVSPRSISRSESTALLAKPRRPRGSENGGDVSGWDLLKQMDFWLLFTLLGIGAACGLMYINNVGSIVRALAYSLGYDDEETQQMTNAQVSILSGCNSLGRVLIGVLSDFLLRRFDTPRSYLLCASVVLAIFGQLTLLFVVDLNLLYISSITIGLSYGFFFSIIPTIVGDIFGPKSFGTNWGWVVLSPAIVGPVTNLFFGYVYDKHSFEGEGGLMYCSGDDCYRAAFFLSSLMEVICLILTFWFTWRRRREDMYPADF